MTPEERELLQKSVALSEENNKVLHSILRSMRVQRIMTVVYWLFLLGSAVGAYYIIQPYLKELISVNDGGVREIFKNFQNTPR